MSQLVCPMCSESLNEEGSHFYKHFKYKRYACGENSCDTEFYTEAERNAHCTKHNHKRSFQKTVNPYIDKLISIVVEDAHELATKDMEIVLDNRWGNQSENFIQKSPITHATPAKSVNESRKNKRSIAGTPSLSSTPSNKKTKTATSTMAAPGTSPFAFLNNTMPSDSSIRAPTDLSPPPPPVPTPLSARPISSNSAQAIVDSTTSDHNLSFDKPPPSKKAPRKKRNESEAGQRRVSDIPKNPTYEQMSAIDKLTGWFDPNVPERQDAAKVICAVCNAEIIYDFILRRGHVTERHMSADIDPNDYDDLLKTAMDRSFPDLPNSSLACQLCMTGTDVRKTLRREHIEKLHTTSLPPLTCPMTDCERGFRRQCDLSTHMKETHKTSMSQYKDGSFQLIRRRRNIMIGEMINKCFPWSTLELIENKVNAMERTESTAPQSIAIDSSLNRDVRVRDVNKTRRAPQYNADDSSSSSSDSECDEATSGNGETVVLAAQDFHHDVIFIGQQFNSEVAKKLSQRGTSVIRIKPEIVENEYVVLNDAPIETEDVRPPSRQTPVKEEPKQEEIDRIPMPVPSILSQYEPIVPPPATSPDPLNTPPHIPSISLPTRILSATNVFEERSYDDLTSRQTSREPITYDVTNRWSQRNDTGHHYNRSYRANPRGHPRGNTYSSTSRQYVASYANNNRHYAHNNNENSESSRRSDYNSSRPSSSNSHHPRSSYRNDDRNNRSSRWQRDL